MYSNILVGVDGSENAYKALDSAIGLAEKLSSKLTLLYVVHVPTSVSEYDTFEASEVFSNLEEDGGKVLGDCESKAKQHNVPVKTILASGDPAQQIIDTAKAEGVDLIVLGSRGLGTVQSLVLGSVSNKIVHYAKGAILIIKPE